ncbi:MAG: hypothetical protein ABJL54_10600 [Halioglobus sp.]
MTEYEILDLISSNTSDLVTMFTVYLSLVTAYVAVGYFAGAGLSTIQAGALTTLFIFGSVGHALGQYNVTLHSAELFMRLSEIRPLTTFESGYVSTGVAWTVALLIGIAVALGFMWNVRHTKEK